MRYVCCSEHRRRQVQGHPTVNGIDFLEVIGDPKAPTLEVHLINDLAGPVAPEWIAIKGGERITDVVVTGVSQVSPRLLAVSVNQPGDFSTYTLRISPPLGDPLVLDQMLSSVTFSFRVHCSADFDCDPEIICPPEPLQQPVINYLAKDFASFRTLMLDRLTTLMPDWQERNVADLSVTLAEVLAYVGDYLSYRQDAVATEAYLGTARRRISVRRHARLVDYRMHDGCNARAWVQVQVSADGVRLERGTPLFTRVAEDTPRFASGSVALEQAVAQEPEFFETMHEAVLFVEHNRLPFYTWGETDCCLPRGATGATLQGHLPNLKAGDVLVLAEVRGAESGDPADALPSRRHAVRLKHVRLSEDPLGGRFLPAPNDNPVPVTEVTWVEEDELPSSLCLAKRFTPRLWGQPSDCLPLGASSATLQGHLCYLAPGDSVMFTTPGVAGLVSHTVGLTSAMFSSVTVADPSAPDGTAEIPVTEVTWDSAEALPFVACVAETQVTIDYPLSIALGNIVLADHGRTIVEALEEAVPEPYLHKLPARTGDHCQEHQLEAVPPRYVPALLESPVTCVASYAQDSVFQLPFKAEYRLRLDSHQLPADLQSAFGTRGIGFADGLSIQGSISEWSISDDQRAYRIRHIQDDSDLGDDHLQVFALPPPVSTIRQSAPQDALPEVVLVATRRDPTSIEMVTDTLGRSSLLRQALRAALIDALSGELWRTQHDLLNSDRRAREFVVEAETDGTAYLRFGDDQFGQRPESGTRFVALYRVGNGTGGNVGSNAIAHIVTRETAIMAVRNPMPAWGGTDPESIHEVRQRAPFAFRRQERAVTLEDYAAAATHHPEVQRAVATRRWTGSWHTIFLTIDRVNGLPVDGDFERRIGLYLERYRLAGHDLEIEGPEFVSLEIEMTVCVEPAYFRTDVKEALLERFSSGWMASGQLGLFHPNNFTFGQPVYLSQLYAAAEEIQGVASVEITKFQRQGSDDDTTLESGRLEIGRLEIARLENNPNFPERGVLRLTMKGGK